MQQILCLVLEPQDRDGRALLDVRERIAIDAIA